MSYGLRLYGDFTNYRSGNTKRVEIHQKDYTGGSSPVDPMSAQPLVEKSRATKDDVDKHIIGREMEFSFWALKDGADYSFILNSGHKDLLMVTKTNGNIDFVGWVKSENVTKGFIEGFYEYTIPASDGLADLKDMDYERLFGTPTSMFSLLEIVENSLYLLQYHRAVDDPEYRIICNTYESTLMTSDQCALIETYARNRRFFQIKEGKTEPDSAYTAIEKVLRNFNLRLRQIHGKWYIINRNETDSYQYEVPRDVGGFIDPANTVRSSISNVISLSGPFTPWGDVSTMHPLKGIEVKFRNRSLGEEYDGVNEWNNEWTKNNITVDSETTDHITFTMVPGASDMYMTSSTFSVAKRTENDYIKLSFDYKTNTDIPLFKIKNDAAYFEIDLIGPSGSSSETRTVFGGYMDTSIYQTLETNNVDQLKINEDGDYQLRIRFSIVSAVSASEVEMEFDGQPSVTLISIGDAGEISDVTFDQSITATQPGGRGTQTVETFFGDSGNTSDIGAFKDSAGDLTENWNRYNETDELSIIELYLQNRMNNRRDYSEVVTVDYWDESEELSPEKVLLIDSKHYEIIGYTKDHKNSYMTLRLIQIKPHTLYTDV